MSIVHLVSSAPFKIRVGKDARSRCGKVACVETVGIGACKMLDAAGNQFYGTTHLEAASCKKCINLVTIGTINGRPSRTPDAAKRRPVDRRPAAVRSARRGVR